MTAKADIIHHITRRIESGELGAGAKLPTQASLAREFQVSDVTVLGAYKELVSHGKVERKPGDGYYVIGQVMSLDEALALAKENPSWPESEVSREYHDLAQLEHDQPEALDAPDPDDDLRPTIAWYNRRSKVIAKHKPCSFTDACEIECVHGWVELVVRD